MRKIACFTCRINHSVEQKIRQPRSFSLFLLLIILSGVFVGCRITTPIDPTGEYIFRDASSAQQCPCPSPYNGNCQTCPSPQRTQTTWLGSSRDPNSTVSNRSTPLLSDSRDISELILGPTDPVARVGTYVVMVAGVKDKSGKYRKNKQVEWTIDCSSPGGFIDVDRRDWCDIFVGEWDPPRIENPRHAFTSTSRKPLRLTKGTPTPLDDVIVHEGQTWTAISSPCEGTTKLTAVALDSSDWRNRLRAANIHWIDAWPILPPAKIAQNYSQPLKLQSSVLRSNGSAATGCIAVYEIVSGDDVEFKTNSDNSTSENITKIIVPVGLNGVAEAQLIKKSTSAGQTRIRTTLIRDNSDGRFTVPIRLAQGETIVEWGEAGLQISRSGPDTASTGTEIVYRITVRNVNTEQLNEIVVTDTVPESFEYQRSIPVGRVLDALVTNADGTRSQKIQWTIPSLESGQVQTFDVVYRAQNEGDFNLVSTAQSGSIQAEDVLRTRVIASGGVNQPHSPAPTATPYPLTNQDSSSNAELDIQLVCQDTARVGNEVVMYVYVTNRGSETVANMLSSVSFTAGLCSPFGLSPVHLKPIEPIEPGKTRSVSLPFTANSIGRQTINLELITPNGQKFNRQTFVNIEENACQTQNDNSVYPTNPVGSSANSLLDSNDSISNNVSAGIDPSLISLNITAPNEAKKGEDIQITLNLGNYSDDVLNNIRLTCYMDSALEIVKYTDGLVTDNPKRPYWNNIEPVSAKSGTRFVLVVRGRTAMPTVCSFVVQQGNIDLVKKDCQILITEANASSVPDSTSPDNLTIPDSLDPIPDVSMPEPDANLTPEPNAPSLDDPSLEVPAVEDPAPSIEEPGLSIEDPAPTVEDPGLDSLDNLTPGLSDLDVPDTNNNLTADSNDKINVDISTRRSKIANNQTFTCQVNLNNTSSVSMNNVELSFYFPTDSFKLVKLGTTGETPYDYNALGGFITFKPVAALEPGQSLNYNIRLLPQKKGIIELSAIITAKESGTTDVRQNAKITVKVE